MSKGNHDFGRDEMAALFGGLPAEADESNRPGGFLTQQHQQQQQRKDHPGKEMDLSSLTAAQTAALLKSQKKDKQKKGSGTQMQRHRALASKGTTPQHMALADELLLSLQEQEKDKEEKIAPLGVHGVDQRDYLPQMYHHQSGDNSSGSDNNDDDFVILQKSKRVKTEARIVMQPKVLEQSRRRRGRQDSSSSGSSSEEDDSSVENSARRKSQRRRRGNSSSSNSDDDCDDSEDDRRKRLLAKRRQSEKREHTNKGPVHAMKEGFESGSNVVSTKNLSPSLKESKLHHKEDTSSSSSSSSSSEGSSSSGESSSSSESEVEPIASMAKPMFVPKHKRNAIKATEQLEQEAINKQQQVEQLQQQQKMASRALLAKVVAEQNNPAAIAANENDTDTGDQDDELKYGASTNPPPNDRDPVKDPTEMEQERDAWEVRELSRLLQEIDRLELLEREELELQKRRNMTDAEVLQLDQAQGKYKRPGQQDSTNGGQQQYRNVQENKKTGNFMQRFYHRGAFYLDEDTLKEAGKDDVRHKAAEYARAATGEDKIDKSKLPEVMQVRGFGLAGNGTRYKGLAQEDTTDRRAEILPLTQPKSKHWSKDASRSRDSEPTQRNR